jgi:hypothetical protein
MRDADSSVVRSLTSTLGFFAKKSISDSSGAY